MADVEWDDAEAKVVLHDAEVDILRAMSTEVADTARGILPRRTGRAIGEVEATVAEDSQGVHADVSSVFYVRFLDPRAKHIHKPTKGLPTALELVARHGRIF